MNDTQTSLVQSPDDARNDFERKERALSDQLRALLRGDFTALTAHDEYVVHVHAEIERLNLMVREMIDAEGVKCEHCKHRKS